MLSPAPEGQTEPPSHQPTLIYDGNCGFCRRWVSRLQRWDRGCRIRYLPLQDPLAPTLAGVSRATLEQAVHFVRLDGATFAGARAAPELFAFLPGGWFPRSIFRIPGCMRVADRVYRYVARRWGPVP